MKICVDCQREMKCTKTGAVANYGDGHIYRGDIFACPEALVRYGADAVFRHAGKIRQALDNVEEAEKSRRNFEAAKR